MSSWLIDRAGLAAGRDGFGRRRAARRLAAVVDVRRRLAEGFAVLEHGVDLPRSVGTVDPHLVLLGEATGAALIDGRKSFTREAGLVRRHFVGRHHFDTEVVEAGV